MSGTRRVTYLALLVSIGLVLGIIESSLPPLLPVPGAKLGLANIAGVIALFSFGPGMALEVTVLRCLIGGILRGSVVGLLLSFSGGVVSMLVMIAVYVLARRFLSVIGVSVVGAVTHNVTQLGIAYLLVGHSVLFYYLPYMMIISVPTGLFVGFCSSRVGTSLEGLRLAGE